MQTRFLLLATCFGAFVCHTLPAANPPASLTLTVGTNGQRSLNWPLVPALDELKLSRGSNVANLNIDLTPGITRGPSGYSWSESNGAPGQFYGLRVGQLGSNALLTTTLLNRLAYGPTPDELARVTAMGPQAYITEQLAPENTPEPPQNLFITSPGFGSPYVGPSGSNGWVRVIATGTMTSNHLYIYMNAPGQALMDDIRLVEGTNADVGQNLVVNGDFETLPLTSTWVVAPNHSGSYIDAATVCQGNGSLHLDASSAGSGRTTSINQILSPQITNGSVCTLSFWYLPLTNYGAFTIRLSGSGINVTRGPAETPPPPRWVYVTKTGVATSTTLYMYVSDLDDGTEVDFKGELYIDDVKMVPGSVPEVGQNVIRNGDFEQAFPGTNWVVSPNHGLSAATTNTSRSGQWSLHMIATNAAGTTMASSIYQTNLALTVGQVYTLSYWVLHTTDRQDGVIRLSGAAAGNNTLYGTDNPTGIADQHRNLENVTANLSILRRWFCLNAVESKRQLFEVLSQFLENHFVTQHSKSSDYFDAFYDGGDIDRYATAMEYAEIKRWRNAMLSPQCSFYDLLKISAESPAMIIYLDTVDSRSDGANIANENYGRELLELFCNGVDNGYDQGDIVQMSRAWTGWTVDIVNAEDAGNPFAARANRTLVPGRSINTVSNLAGVWQFVYRGARHYTNAATPINIFSNKFVEARFGPPYTTKTYGTNAVPGRYQLRLPIRTGTNGIQDGYDVVKHLADLPYTQEYISVKLCRLFVHDDFVHGVYDYSNPSALSEEGKLVLQCMQAWEGSNPKGQIRAVLTAIFNSELFRTHSGSMQKIKTPLEYCISAVRAMRAFDSSTVTYTAGHTDGSFTAPLSRMGAMELFNRGAPDGYAEHASPWINASTLAERIRYVQSLCIAVGTNGHAGNTNDAGTAFANPVALLKLKLPNNGSWNNAGAVADYFLSIIYPAEGKANLSPYRALAVNFLDTADNGTADPFLGLANTGSPYDTRVRGMVGMLMTFQRFNEQ